MKTYTYSYQNVKKPGRLRTASAEAGKLAEYPNARTRPNSPASADAPATQLPGPLGQKFAGNSVAGAAGSKVSLACRMTGMHI